MGLWKVAGQTNGRMGKAIEILTRPARIWSRYLVAQYHQLRGRLVLYDRYIYEARLPASGGLLALKRPYFWLLAHLLPSADNTVVLDLPGQIAYDRKHEGRPEELEAARRLYARLPEWIGSVELIDADRDTDTVRADLTNIVWRELAARWSGQPAQ